MDFKEILGDLYTDEIGNKLNNSGIKFADLSKGEYVSKDKYETADNEAKTYKNKYEKLFSSREDISSKELVKITAERDDYKSKFEETSNKLNSLERGIKVKEAKIDDKFKDFVISEVSKLVDDKTDFDTALKGFVEKNPQYKVPEKTRRVNSSFSMSGNGQNETSKNDVFNNALLMAVGKK